MGSPVITTAPIVVVDSNPILVSITGVLRMAGYAVFQAHDGQAAADLCRLLPAVGLLILNTHVDGLDATALLIAARGPLGDLPVLHVDTHRAPVIPSDIQTLTVPFTADELLEAVGDLLAKGRVPCVAMAVE